MEHSAFLVADPIENTKNNHLAADQKFKLIAGTGSNHPYFEANNSFQVTSSNDYQRLGSNQLGGSLFKDQQMRQSRAPSEIMTSYFPQNNPNSGGPSVGGHNQMDPNYSQSLGEIDSYNYINPSSAGEDSLTKDPKSEMNFNSGNPQLQQHHSLRSGKDSQQGPFDYVTKNSNNLEENRIFQGIQQQMKTGGKKRGNIAYHKKYTGGQKSTGGSSTFLKPQQPKPLALQTQFDTQDLGASQQTEEFAIQNLSHFRQESLHSKKTNEGLRGNKDRKDTISYSETYTTPDANYTINVQLVQSNIQDEFDVRQSTIQYPQSPIMSIPIPSLQIATGAFLKQPEIGILKDWVSPQKEKFNIFNEPPPLSVIEEPSSLATEEECQQEEIIEDIEQYKLDQKPSIVVSHIERSRSSVQSLDNPNNTEVTDQAGTCGKQNESAFKFENLVIQTTEPDPLPSKEVNLLPISVSNLSVEFPNQQPKGSKRSITYQSLTPKNGNTLLQLEKPNLTIENNGGSHEFQKGKLKLGELSPQNIKI